MPDTSEPRATLPFPAPNAEGAAGTQPAAADPLAGDWAEGLRGPLRSLELQRPRRLGQAGPVAKAAPLLETAMGGEQRTEQADLRALAALASSLDAPARIPPPVEAEVEAPDAWASATDDQLASVPPPPREGGAAPAADAHGPHHLDASEELPADAPLQLDAESALPDAPAAARGMHDPDQTLRPLTTGQLAGDEAPHSQGPQGEEEQVLLLSDAELAEDEPHPAAPAEAAPAPAAEAPDVGAPAADPVLAAPLAAPAPAAEAAAAEDSPVAAAPAEPAAAPFEALAQEGPEARVALDAKVPEEGMRALFVAPVVAPGSGGWAAPETSLTVAEAPAGSAAPEVASWTAPAAAAAPPTGGEGYTDLFAAPPIEGTPVGDDAGSTAIFSAPPLSAAPAAAPAPAEAAFSNAPMAPAAQPPAPGAEALAASTPNAAPLQPSAGGPLLDEDLESTVMSLSPTEMLPSDRAALPAPAAATGSAGHPSDELEAEPLPEDAIAGTADPDAPWNHAEIEVSSSQPIPEGAAPWETPASSDAGEWTSVSPLAAGAWGSPASAAAAATGRATPSEPWFGSEPAPAAPAVDTWAGAVQAGPGPGAGDPWAAKPNHGNHDGATWAEAPVAPQVDDPWTAPPTAHSATEWAPVAVGTPAAAAGAADDWSPGAAAPAPTESWAPVAAPSPVDETSWAPVAAPAPAEDARWAPPAAPQASGWEAPPAPALVGPAATIADQPPLDPDDADLLVPVYDEPAAAAAPPPTGALAVLGEHRVAVHTRAGRTRRGMVRDLDLAAGGFSLHPQSGNGAPESVQAAEVKAIFFMLASGEKPAAGSGQRVRVTFEDGRTIEGARDGQDAPGGFFLVPGDAARTNTRRIFVARGAVQELREL